MIDNMKLKLITLTTLSALALGSTVLANDPQETGGDSRGGRGFRHSPLERMTDNLNLTPEQKTKIQPLIDQAQPQLEQIHREAMQKSKAVMDNIMAQIRPLLTPEQQKKLDESKSNRWDRHDRMRRHHRDQEGQSDEGDQ